MDNYSFLDQIKTSLKNDRRFRAIIRSYIQKLDQDDMIEADKIDPTWFTIKTPDLYRPLTKSELMVFYINAWKLPSFIADGFAEFAVQPQTALRMNKESYCRIPSLSLESYPTFAEKRREWAVIQLEIRK